MTKYGVIVGTLIPALLIIILGLLWIDQGNPIAFLLRALLLAPRRTNMRLFPHFTGFGSVAFLAGIVLLFAGVEVQAVQLRP